MYCSFITSRFLLLAICIFFLNTSFKNHPVEKKGIKEIAVANDHFPGADQATTGTAPDDLYELIISGSDFLKKKTDKWVFKFVHVREEALTLHGWYANGFWGRSFDTAHEIELEPTGKAVRKYSTDTYFGDIVLKRKDVRKIKRLIKEKDVVTVIFTPQLNPGTHISYKITLKPTGLTVLQETFDANPSPPKGFQ